MPNNAIKRLRAHAFHLQQGLCFYCCQPMWLLTDPTTHARTYGLSLRQAMHLRATAEHLLARRDGGTNSPENVVAACICCNRRRHARPVALEPDRYRVLVQRRIAQHRWHFRGAVDALRASHDVRNYRSLEHHEL